jgi:hypothetical protein
MAATGRASAILPMHGVIPMDERQKLLDELTRHLTLRGLTTDEQALRAIDEKIRDIENRLEEIDQQSESDQQRGC